MHSLFAKNAQNFCSLVAKSTKQSTTNVLQYIHIIIKFKNFKKLILKNYFLMIFQCDINNWNSRIIFVFYYDDMKAMMFILLLIAYDSSKSKRWFICKMQNGIQFNKRVMRLSRNSVVTSKNCALWVRLYVNLYQLPVQLLQFIVGLETMSGVKWSLLVIMYQPSLASAMTSLRLRNYQPSI